MATHQISKHTINLKQKEFSISLLLKNILKGILTVKTDLCSKALFNTNIYFLKRSNFHSLLHQKKSQTILEKNILLHLLDFVNLKNKISKNSRKNFQYISVYTYLK